MAKEELKEFKADGEDSAIADPIATGPNDRKADLKKKANPTADSVVDLIGINKGESLLNSGKTAKQAPARLADKRSVKESVSEIFEGSELSEEFKDKAGTIFEAVVIERVNEIQAELEEEYAAKFVEVKTALDEKINNYLNYVVEQFLEENEVAIESATKVAVAESFMDGLKTLFTEHNVELPDDGIDIIEGLEERIAELEKNLNESEAKNVELSNTISEANVSDIVSEMSEGLTETQKDRLATLAEGISYSNIDEFKSKISTLKESFVAKKVVNGEVLLDEEFAPNVETKATVIDPIMASYVNAASRTLKK